MLQTDTQKNYEVLLSGTKQYKALRNISIWNYQSLMKCYEVLGSVLKCWNRFEAYHSISKRNKAKQNVLQSNVLFKTAMFLGLGCKDKR